MRLGRGIGAVAAVVFCSTALAQAPETSPRPLPRPAPAVATASAVDAAVAQALADPAPAQDPIGAFLQRLSLPRAAMAAAAPLSGSSVLAVARSLRPQPRPRGFALRVALSEPGADARPVRGAVCGERDILGEAIPSIPSRIAGCGVANPVRVTSVAGIPLSQAPTVDCTTAKALNDWVKTGVIPAVGRTGGGVARINIIAHYACRSRNNQPGAKISEHGKGHAVDVAGVTLRDGTTLTVLDHWRSTRYGRIIQAMYRSACGPFGTVLGPNSDRFHQNHLHVDTARYRGGPYCR